MTITSQLDPTENSLTITVKGRFDFSALQTFRGAYENVEGKVNQYTVDLTDADYLDSSALGMLLALRDHAGGDDAKVKVINCKPDVKKILIITKLDELFIIE